MQNTNPALQTSYLMKIAKFPDIDYFVTNITVPGMNMNGIDMPFKNQAGQLPSNRIDFDPLSFDMIIGEDFANWLTLFNWMKSIRHGNRPITEEMADVTVHLFSSNKTQNRLMNLRGAFPTNVASFMLDSQTTDPQPVLCPITMKYQDIDFQ